MKKKASGVYDLQVQFWYEEDIRFFSCELVRSAFSKEKENIKIEEYGRL